MTISNQESFVVAEGNGVTTQFSYSFLIPTAADVVVTITDISVSPPVDTILLNTQYTITGLGSSAGGLVMYPLAGPALAASRTITIARILPIVQDVSISNQGNFYPKVVEGALDYLTMICQDIGGQVDVIEAEIADLTRADVSIVSSTTNAVSTVALLRSAAISAPLVGTLINVEGYYVANDGGGGLFYITNVNPGADNGGTIIYSNTAGFYYLRQTDRITPDMFGAKGDGSTNDAVALQAAITASRKVYLNPKTYLYNGALVMPANTEIAGSGPSSKFSGNNVAKITIDASNVYLHDFSFIGDGSEVIKIGRTSSASNIVIERVGFVPTIADHLDQCVSLYTCDNIIVRDCNFSQVLYGVIHQAGSTSGPCSNIRILNNTFSDMYGDAANFNGADPSRVASYINIEGNTFLGSHDWTTPALERRFVAFTSVNSVKVINNIVINCAGDSAVHCEDIGGRLTIADNHFIDCGVGGGNDGYIYVLNSSKTMIVANNWFVRTSASAGTAFLSTQSISTSGDITIIGNNFKDTSGHIATALNLSSHIGTTIISDNYCFGCDKFVYLPSADSIAIRGNTIESVSTGIGGNTATNIDVIGNRFSCSPDCILTTTGSKWTIKDNKFIGGSVTGTNMTDVWMMGNTFSSTVVTRTMAAGTPTNVLQTNWNFKEGTGLV